MHLLHHPTSTWNFKQVIRWRTCISQAKEIVDHGIKEIVLTGVNIGDYGKGEFGNKKHEHTFLELVQALDEVEGIDRFRTLRLSPTLSEELINFVAVSKRFALIFIFHFRVETMRFWVKCVVVINANCMLIESIKSNV